MNSRKVSRENLNWTDHVSTGNSSQDSAGTRLVIRNMQDCDSVACRLVNPANESLNGKNLVRPRWGLEGQKRPEERQINFGEVPDGISRSSGN